MEKIWGEKTIYVNILPEPFKLNCWVPLLYNLSYPSEEDTIASMVYREQKERKWPGLASETATICQELGIEDHNETCGNKKDYKNMMMAACHSKNKESLLSLASGKYERIMGEQYEKKEYLSKKNIHDVRIHFRTRFGLQRFAGNYSKDESFISSNWLCKCLQSREVYSLW